MRDLKGKLAERDAQIVELDKEIEQLEEKLSEEKLKDMSDVVRDRLVDLSD